MNFRSIFLVLVITLLSLVAAKNTDKVSRANYGQLMGKMHPREDKVARMFGGSARAQFREGANHFSFRDVFGLQGQRKFL